LKEEADRVERIRSVKRGGLAADAPPRGTFERYWLDKYGERMDSIGFVDFAACVHQPFIETRLAISFLPEYVHLLEKQKKARERLFSRHLRGRSVPMAELLQTARDTGVKPLRIFHEMAEKAIEEARDYAELLIGCDDSIRRSRTRAPNDELRLVAAYLSEWIRRNHRDTRGTKDGKTSWPDTARALEWLGWDLSAIGSDKGDAVRKLAERHWRRWGTEFREPSQQDPLS